jgi:hypothetical protein
MTNITVAVPDELAEMARIRGLLEPQRLTPLVCEVLTRFVANEAGVNDKVEIEQSPSEALLSLAGVAGPGLPVDFASNHDRYIHGT